MRRFAFRRGDGVKVKRRMNSVPYIASVTQQRRGARRAAARQARSCRRSKTPVRSTGTVASRHTAALTTASTRNPRPGALNRVESSSLAAHTPNASNTAAHVDNTTANAARAPGRLRRTRTAATRLHDPPTMAVSEYSNAG